MLQIWFKGGKSFLFFKSNPKPSIYQFKWSTKFLTFNAFTDPKIRRKTEIFSFTIPSLLNKLDGDFQITSLACNLNECSLCGAFYRGWWNRRKSGLGITETWV